VLLSGAAHAVESPLEAGLAGDSDGQLFRRLVASLKLTVDTKITDGTFFVPTDRVRKWPRENLPPPPGVWTRCHPSGTTW
jgi:hypothetical protein